MGLPTFTLEAAIGYGPLSTVPVGAWTSLGAIHTCTATDPSRQSETDTFSGGRLNVEVDNSTRALDPTYAGALGVTIGTPVRIIATWASTAYPQWYGYVDELAPTWMQMASDFATITCTDSFAFLGSVFDTGFRGAAITDGAYALYHFDDAASTATIVDSLHGKNLAVRNLPDSHGAVILNPTPIIPGTPSLVTADIGHSWYIPGQGWMASASMASWYPPGAFTIEGWFELQGNDQQLVVLSDGATSGIGIVVGSLYTSGAAGVGVPALDIATGAGDTYVAGPRSINDGAAHHLVVTRSTGATGTFRFYVDGVLVGSTTSAAILNSSMQMMIGTNRITFSGTINTFIDELAIYPVALSAAQILNHYKLGTAPWAGDTTGQRVSRLLDIIGWPAALRSIDTGLTVLPGLASDAFANGPIDTLQHFQSVVEAEGGRLFTGRDGSLVFHERHRPLRSPYDTVQAVYSDSTDHVTGALPATTPAALPYVTGGLRGSESAAEVFNRVSITRRPVDANDTPVAQIVDDAASQTALKMVKTLNQSDQLNPTDQEANNKARAILRQRANPLFRIRELSLDGRATDALWPEILGRQIGDLVRVIRHPPGGGAAYDDQLRIEGRTLTISKRSVTAKFVASKADTAKWMRIGDTLGGVLFW
jgi:hypothetical protein